MISNAIDHSNRTGFLFFLSRLTYMLLSVRDKKLFQPMRLSVIPFSLLKVTSFKFSKTSIFLVLTVLVVHSLFITYGSGVFLAGEMRGRTFDSLGDNLLKGETHVDPSAIEEEAYYINGKTYTYYGPLLIYF